MQCDVQVIYLFQESISAQYFFNILIRIFYYINVESLIVLVSWPIYVYFIYAHDPSIHTLSMLMTHLSILYLCSWPIYPYFIYAHDPSIHTLAMLMTHLSILYPCSWPSIYTLSMLMTHLSILYLCSWPIYLYFIYANDQSIYTLSMHMTHLSILYLCSWPIYLYFIYAHDTSIYTLSMLMVHLSILYLWPLVRYKRRRKKNIRILEATFPCNGKNIFFVYGFHSREKFPIFINKFSDFSGPESIDIDASCLEP